MNYKKVILLNGTFSGSQHEMIDSSIIIAFAMIAEKVVVYFQPRRKGIIKSLVEQRIDKKNITYKTILNLPDSVRVTFRELIAAIQECWIFLTKADKNTLTCLTYINRFNCYGLNFLSKITHKPLIIICHGEIRVACTQRHKDEINWVKMLRRFYGQTILAKNARLVVLGEYIKHNIGQYIPKENISKLLFFDHPYFSTSERMPHSLHTPIRIGVIGYLKRESERGFENVKKMAIAIADNDEFELRLLSSVERELVNELPDSVRLMNPDSVFIPRNEYNKMIEELDYIYCPYPTGAFKAIASGALLEAISKHKPIIMHKNEHAMYLRKKYGEFGIVMDDSEDAFVKIRPFLNDMEQYKHLQLMQDSLLTKLSPENLSDQLKQICDSI